MTLKEIYEEAVRRKKGLIISGQVGGRMNDLHLVEYVEKNAEREVGLSGETKGFLIVRLKRRRG